MLYSDKAWGLKITRFLYSVTFWLHRPLTVWWVPLLGLFTLFSGNTNGHWLWTLSVHRPHSHQAASKVLGLERRRHPNLGFSFCNLGLLQTKEKLGNRGHSNFLFWNCVLVKETGLQHHIFLLLTELWSTIRISTFVFVCLFWIRLSKV